MLDIQASPLRAFHGNSAIKVDRLARVAAHRAADDLQRGMTGEGGKGCAVWCTLDAYDHARYPIELGIPEWLARVEDTLFEGMSIGRAMGWPTDFLEACAVGADLECAKAPFLIHVLRSTLKHFDHAANPQVVAAVEGSIALWGRTDIGSADWESAWSAARSAAESADSAAESARSAAWSAWSAAWSARSAAWSAWSAAESADSAAESARSAAWSAWSAAYDEFADTLLTILREIKPSQAPDATGGA